MRRTSRLQEFIHGKTRPFIQVAADLAEVLLSQTPTSIAEESVEVSGHVVRVSQVRARRSRGLFP